MRRFVGLVVLLFLAIPFGLSVSGCHKALPVQYCNAGDSGPEVGQVASITLSPTLATYGESLSYGQIGTSLSANAVDCKGNNVSVSRYTYATSDMTVADINPATGQVCAGLWNQHSGGGIPDFTTCNPPAVPSTKYLAYVTATGNGAVSNAIPVYIHGTVTGVVLGNASVSCATDPATNCNPTTLQPTTTSAYGENVCVSQGQFVQLVARVYTNGTTNPADNITYMSGHLTFAAENSSNVVTIDQNGVATANQPGSATITASVANSSSASSAGFFSTCPPASIVLSVPGKAAGTSSIILAQNNAQPLVATVLDTNGVTLTGLGLEFNSTTPQTVPASSSTITPIFPGTATITAVCQPGTCNPSPFSQIGYLGNGTPITSNGITVTTPGTTSTVLYMGSTSSVYLMPMDFTLNQPSALIKLTYVPNSMVITQDGSAIYLGTTQGLETVSTASNSQGGVNPNVPGTVLSVSPDGSTLVITDPNRQTISLYSTSASSVVTVYGGVGTHAAWSPDSQTVYITTTNNTLLTHSNFTNWQPIIAGETYSDVAVTVPSVGAYFAGPASTDGRSYCPFSTSVTVATPPVETNNFAPLADSQAVPTDRLTATDDGAHILGAHQIAGAGKSTLTDLTVALPVTTACPTAPLAPKFNSTSKGPTVIPTVNATAIDGVVAASNSALAFVTYTGTSGVLPYYLPGTSTLGSLTLANSATAPISGVFSTDNLTFFTGTSGDDAVHLINTGGTVPVESGTILKPNLQDANGNLVAPNLIVQRPKKPLS